MGQTIEKIALGRGHTIAGKIDIGDTRSYPEADVAIEFTQPEAAVSNMKRCIDAGIPVVCGTTGWLRHKSEVEQYCREKNGTLFHTSNFSLGVNIFFHLNEYLSAIMSRYPEYQPEYQQTQSQRAFALP